MRQPQDPRHHLGVIAGLVRTDSRRAYEATSPHLRNQVIGLLCIAAFWFIAIMAALWAWEDQWFMAGFVACMAAPFGVHAWERLRPSATRANDR